jgi:hypothetical protein
MQTTASSALLKERATPACCDGYVMSHLVLSVSRHLKMTVDVGLVVGTMPATA